MRVEADPLLADPTTFAPAIRASLDPAVLKPLHGHVHDMLRKAITAAPWRH